MTSNKNKISDSVIFIVDDNVNNLQLLGGLLKQVGYKIQLLQSGLAAINSLHHNVPDLILLDIMMPEMDGFEVATRLQADTKFARIPIIFISANNDEQSIVRGFECGGRDYISKPFIESELLARVKNQLIIHWNEQNLTKVIEAKNTFFAQMTSTLKNPLSQLASFSQMLPSKIEESDYTKAIEYANIIQETAIGQFKVFENLIEWARIQTGHYNPFFEDIDLASNINSCISLLNPIIQAKSINISTNYETGIALADQDLLQTVLRNIIHNAVKFSEPKGDIDINVYDQGKSICISIRDFGEGLTHEEAETLFDENTNLKNVNPESEEKGNCMGLRISKELVGLMDGTISATGYSEDGTEIRIILASGL